MYRYNAANTPYLRHFQGEIASAAGEEKRERACVGENGARGLALERLFLCTRSRRLGGPLDVATHRNYTYLCAGGMG